MSCDSTLDLEGDEVEIIDLEGDNEEVIELDEC